MSEPARPAYTARYYEQPPLRSDADGTRHWITRGTNFVVVATQASAGAVLNRPAAQQSDEYMLLLPEALPARIEAGGRLRFVNERTAVRLRDGDDAHIDLLLRPAR